MIQWTTGDNDGGVNGLGGTPAQVGVNKGDGLEAVIANGSRTNNIINISSESNVGIPGMFVFDITEGTAPVGECIECIRACMHVHVCVLCTSCSDTVKTLGTYLLHTVHIHDF